MYVNIKHVSASKKSHHFIHIDQTAEVTPKGSDCEGILAKMAETFRLKDLE